VIYWALLAIQALVSTAGVTLLKIFMPSRGFTSQPIGVWLGLSSGAVLYATSFLLWIFLLSKLPLTYAYPISIGISLLTTTLIGLFFLKEQLSGPAIAGLLLLPIALVLLSVRA
jgi:multidrug transporter EmrE-like cation transporter